LPRAALLWAPVLAWMALLFYLSSRSDIGPAARVPDWITHGTAYLVLGLLLGRAVAGGVKRRLTTAGAFAVVGLCTLYGITDEIHQSFVPGRDASAGDVAKDFAGGAIAAFVLHRRSSAAAGTEG
jgi:VanZ family protein